MAQEETYDFIVVGSGGGSAPAALVMKEAGKRVLIIEKEPMIGGTSAYSGGLIWIPNNGVSSEKDSVERSRAYLDAVIGDVGPASTPERRDAFVRNGAEMVRFLQDKGMKFAKAWYPDYYPDAPGGLDTGRSLGAELFDVNRLGEWGPKLAHHPMTAMLPISSAEAVHLFEMTRNWRGKMIAMRLGFRWLLRKKLLGQELRGAGNALQGRLYEIVLREKIPIWAATPVTDLIVENDRVVGVVCQRNGETVRVRAELGVLLNAGGFSRNKEMREKYQPKPTSTAWTQVNPGHTGEMIQTAERLGAAIDLMDDSYWLVCSFMPDGTFMGMHSSNDISRPYSLIVGADGKRFANESTNYMSFGQAMYAAGAVPAWVILESRYRRYYPWGALPAGITPKRLIESGYMKKASSLDDLARQCGIDAEGLKDTVKRFNGFAKTGVDEDFHRGATVYDQFFGDPTVKPNPNLGPIEKPPYYAVQLWPADVGTAGGVVCDENSRVLRKDGTPIQGLYATGITTATVVGRTYPGAGASVGPSMTFGYIAARHAARVNA
jgi:3-oxosteroid 1-dehydrogenase